MKRLLLLVMCGVMFLSGCTATATEDLRSYDDDGKQVMIPVDPERIVTDLYVGQLLSIGAPIVGGDLTYQSPAWSDQVGEITNIGQSTELVASLSPDLIIISDPSKLASYEAIAPTVLIEYGDYNEEELVSVLGDITNRQANAEEVLSEFNSRVDELRSLSTGVDSLSILEFFGNDPYVYGNKYGRLGYVIYDKLDIKCTVVCEETILSRDDSYLLLTQENLTDYIADILIVSSPNAEKVSNDITNSDVFKNSTAVKNSNVYYVDSNLFYQTDMISIMEQINVFEEILNEVNK